MTRKAIFLLMSAASTTALCAIVAAPAKAAETDVMCKINVQQRTIRCGNGTVLNITSDRSTVLGDGATALGDDNTAVGASAHADDDGDTAIGSNSTASNGNATAVGYLAKATDTAAIAVGVQSKASGSASTAIGALADASGEQAIAFGTTAKANSTYAVAIGANSKALQTDAFAAGTLAQATEASAMALGKQSSAGGFQAIAIGANSNAVGKSAVALGAGANATGDSAYAIGGNAFGPSSVAIRGQANGISTIAFQGTAVGERASALGYMSMAQADDAIALGTNSSSSFVQSTALGFGAATTKAKQVALGGLGSHVAVGDINASTSAQDASSVTLSTVDANGVLGKSNVTLAQLNGIGTPFDAKYLEDGIADLNANLGLMGTFVTTQLGFASTALDQHDTRITALENGSAGGGFDPKYLETGIADLGSDLGDLTSSVETLSTVTTANHAEHAIRIGALEDLGLQYQQAFGALDTAMAQYDMRITALEGSGPVPGGPIFDPSEIDAKNSEQDGRLEKVEAKNDDQDMRLVGVEVTNDIQTYHLGQIDAKNEEQDERLSAAEVVNSTQDARIEATETKNAAQDARLAGVEDVNAQQAAALTNHGGRITSLETGAVVMAAQMKSMQSTLADHTAQIATIQGQVGKLFDISEQNRRGIDRANEGVAMALAMESPAVPSGKSFAVSGGVGNYQGRSALSMAITAAVKDTLSFSAGVGYGVNSGKVGTRAGFQFAF